MRRERISEDELAAAIRASALPGVEATHAVVIETDGTISVLPRREQHDEYGALEHVAGATAG